MLRIQTIRCQARFTRGCCALAAALQEGTPARKRRALLGVALGDARGLAREKLVFSAPMGELLRAAVEANRGRRDDAITLLEHAAAGFEGAGMKLWAAASRRARGTLLGDAEGRELAESAEAVMREEGIVDPARIAAMLAPGFRTTA
jgi:hypothetical protein